MNGLNHSTQYVSKWIAAAALAASIASAAAQDPRPARTIVVSLEDRKMALLENGQIRKVYTVGVGKPATPSPVGNFTIERRVANPVYHHAGKTVMPGPANPVGSRWMGLNKHGYGIHGTNEPKSIGKAASHGCIRMEKADLEEIYSLVSVGDRVELIGRRNQETASLFDTPKTALPEFAVIANSDAITPPAVNASLSPSPATFPVVSAGGSR